METIVKRKSKKNDKKVEIKEDEPASMSEIIEEMQQEMKEDIQEEKINVKELKEVKKTTKISKKKVDDTNQKIIENLKILEEYENIVNKEPYKAKAYSKAIDTIELLENPIKTKEDLKGLKSIGKSIADKIIEFIETGKMHSVQRALSDDKFSLSQELSKIYGMGPANISNIISKINKFEDLYLPENQDLLNDKQKIGLKYYNDLNEKMPYEIAKEYNKTFSKLLKKFALDVEWEMVGSYRRKKDEVGDIDILIKEKDGFDLKKFIKYLIDNKFIIETLASGKNKFMGICNISSDNKVRRLDILITLTESYPFALLYFTGSKMHNIQMRKEALKQGLHLTEYGLRNIETNDYLDDEFKDEQDIFKHLHMDYVNPSKR